MSLEALVRNLNSYRTAEDVAPEPAGRRNMLTGHTQVPPDGQTEISEDHPSKHATADNREQEERHNSQRGQPAGHVTVPYYGQRDDRLMSLGDIGHTIQKNPLIMLALAGLGGWLFIRYRSA